MPVVSKQSPKPSPKKSARPGSKLRPISELSSNYGVRMVLYGQSKVGKTTLACDFPKPLMIVGTMGTLEDGTLSVANYGDEVQFYPMESSKDIDDVVNEAQNFESIVLDTAGGVQDLVLKEFLGLDDIVLQKSWGTVRQQDWGPINSQTKEILRRLIGLTMSDGKNVVIIAHERAFGGGEDANEAIAPKVGAALTPGVSGWLCAACDYVGQCYIRAEERDKTTKVNNKEVTVRQRTGKMEYCLRIGPHDVFVTGWRKPKDQSVPDDIVDPTYKKIKALIDGKAI